MAVARPGSSQNIATIITVQNIRRPDIGPPGFAAKHRRYKSPQSRIRISMSHSESYVEPMPVCTLTKSPEAILSIGGFGSFFASAAAPIATGWSEPVAGWDSHTLRISAFSRRTEVMEY
jgi:hypothetical protein